MKKTLEERFWRKVNKSEACWVWTGAKIGSGPGCIRINRKTKLAHRVSWELHNGPIPGGMFICHHCDNPPCVNPSHLFMGTHKDNMDDMRRKNRAVESRGVMNGNAKLTTEQIDAIRSRYKEGDVTQDFLAKEYGVCQMTISKVVRKNREYCPV